MNLKPYFERAENNIKKDTSSSLRYACLELRICIEELAYRELRIYLSAFPNGIDAWQPRRVIETLKLLDESVDNDYNLVAIPYRVNGPVGPAVVVGQHRGIATQIINKHYNKIGHYLHAPTPAEVSSGKNSIADLKTYLQNILSELRALNSNAHSADTTTIEFTCEKCGNPVIVSERYVKVYGLAFCTNENCGAQYEVKERNGEFFCLLKIFEFNCPNCKEPIVIEPRLLTPNSKFVCKTCSKRIGFRKEWIPFLEDSGK
ncbi:hypothetical protein JXQ31_12420 [candidate division KSB1 bacterium]|nr:hypothetical protein [candidate division KSB1 bacterium]